MRNIRLLPVLAGIAFLPYILAGQPGAISGPSLGLVFDSTALALRPILGIPGAATLGDPLALEFQLSRASVSPAKGYALAVRADDSSVMLIRDGGEVSALPLSETSPDAIAFNRTGTIAALYFSASKRVQIIDGLPDSPKLARAADLSELPGPLTSLAISADGSSLLAAVSVGDAAVAYLLPANGTARTLGSFATISALRFADGGAEVLIADAQTNSVYLVQSATAEITLLASERDGIAEPADLAVLGRRILVANKASGAIIILDRDGAPPSSVQCACKPTALLRLAGSSVFRLTELSAAPLWMIDAGKTDTPVLAIPMGVKQ
jgi:hypothetical protein